jgi:hypothetical protein
VYCIRVTQVYFSLEKRASPWGSPEVSTPIQYTTAQDMFWVSGGQYTDSVHNRTNLAKVTLVPEVSTPMSH